MIGTPEVKPSDKKAVDACYGHPSHKVSEGQSKKNFRSEPERLEFLFEMYRVVTPNSPIVVNKRSFMRAIHYNLTETRELL